MTPTRILRFSAVRMYVASHTLEVPSFTSDDRIAGLIRRGGKLTSLLAARSVFAKCEGTGFALACLVPVRASQPDFPLSEISAALRNDGFIF